MFGITVEVRDKVLTRLGQIRAEELSLSVTERFNNVGEWTLTIPASHPMAAALRTPGAGIIVTRDDGSTLMSGPVVVPESTASANDIAGTIKVSGVTDLVLLADRLAYPQPSNTDPNTQSASHDVRTGPAETLMHAYVNANVGPAAPTARRDTRLTMGTNLARGASTTKRARFPVLGVLLSEIAAPADLGFRVVQVGGNLQFQTYAVADRTAAIRLDIANGTLASHKVAVAPPGATRVIVGGKGEAVDRDMAEVSTAASVAAETAWGRRIEQFLDRRANTLAELTSAGLEELADKGLSQTSVQAVPAQETSMVFGVDWALGDRVTVVVEGTELTSVVTGYHLRADRDGYRIGAILGDPSGFRTDAGGRIASVERRIANLETNAEPGFSLDKVYPIGAIYMSTVSTNPGTLFGGTWAQIQDRFLLGAGTTYTAGNTGGAASQTLTTSHLPAHTHGVGTLAAANESSHTHGAGSFGTSTNGGHTHGLGRDKDGATGSGEYVSHSTGISGPEQIYYSAMTTDGDHSHSIGGTSGAGSAHTHTLSGATASAGSGTAVPILPPYLVVYMFRRTA